MMATLRVIALTKVSVYEAAWNKNSLYGTNCPDRGKADKLEATCNNPAMESYDTGCAGSAVQTALHQTHAPFR